MIPGHQHNTCMVYSCWAPNTMEAVYWLLLPMQHWTHLVATLLFHNTARFPKHLLVVSIQLAAMSQQTTSQLAAEVIQTHTVDTRRVPLSQLGTLTVATCGAIPLFQRATVYSARSLQCAVLLSCLVHHWASHRFLMMLPCVVSTHSI